MSLQDQLLDRHLRTLFGDIDSPTLALLHHHLAWVEIAGGETLMAQGEPGDSMYLLISGRLRVYVRDGSGGERLVRDMARGEIVGELSLYTDEPRSATVVAVRDSVLVRLDKTEFTDLVESRAAVSTALTRQIVRRLREVPERVAKARPVSIGLVPITGGTDAPGLARRLGAALERTGRVRLLGADDVDRALGRAGIARSGVDDVEANRRISLYLDELEATHDHLLLVADDDATEWTRRCARRSDELLLLANAAAEPALHETERRFLMQRVGRSEAAEVLVLLHPADLRCPRGTRAWLARRPVAGHVHIRPALDRDIGRLARLASRTAIGLVLAGGGARGLAHLGVYRALREHGIEIDWVGGTSIGAVMAGLMASDLPTDELVAIAHRAFHANPTGDFNLLPLLSLIAGRRLRRLVAQAVDDVAGHEADVEDLWKNFFCVASNYSQAREQIVRHGRLDRAVLASIAIPGALPPVLHDGDLLCDGGTFNNFPVDVMRGMPGVGRVIGVDLAFRKPRRFDHDHVPGSWALLRDRLRPHAQRRYKFPSLVSYLMNVTILYSSSRQREAEALADLCFKPPLERVGMLQWNKFDSIVAQGHAHAAELLAALPAERREALCA